MSFAVTAITMQGAGVLIGSVGAAASARGQKAALGLKADIADINAMMDERAAQAVLRSAQIQESRVLLKGAQVKASQRTSSAANGVDVNASDTTQRMLASTEFMRQSDALVIDANAVQQAEAYRMKKVNDENEARFSRATADAINPNVSALTTMVAGAGSVATNWYMMGKYGTFGDNNKYKLDFGNYGGLGLKLPSAYGSTN